MASADDKKVAEMLVACMPTLRAFVRRCIDDRDTASQILQEISLRVLAGNAPQDREDFVRWSRAIAQEVIGTKGRRRPV